VHLCVASKIIGIVLVLVVIGFANTRKSIGNTNTNTYFKKYCNTLVILKSVLIAMKYCSINNLSHTNCSVWTNDAFAGWMA